MGVIGAIAGGGEDDGSSDNSSASATSEESAATEPPATEPPVTEPPVTEAPSTTAAPTTTIALTPEQEIEIAKLAFSTVFEGQKMQVAEILEDSGNAETVDKFLFEMETGDLILDVTSRWASPDNQVDGAWEDTRSLAVLWGRPDGGWYQEVWTPNLLFTNSGTTYNCPGPFMVQLGSLEAGRGDWEATC